LNTAVKGLTGAKDEDKLKAVGALLNLSSDEGNQEEIRKLGGIKLLLNLLSQTSHPQVKVRNSEYVHVTVTIFQLIPLFFLFLLCYLHQNPQRLAHLVLC